MKKELNFNIIVPASVDEVWNCWTTEEGAKTFFAPDCKIELKPDGAYEMYFDPEAEKGSRGGEELKILAFQENRFLSFTWNAPPDFPRIRNQKTHVSVYFYKIDDNNTEVILFHDGWGEDEEWNKVFDYFNRAWGKVVLPRLKYRFENGPVDWKNPPKFE